MRAKRWVISRNPSYVSIVWKFRFGLLYTRDRDKDSEDLRFWLCDHCLNYASVNVWGLCLIWECYLRSLSCLCILGFSRRFRWITSVSVTMTWRTFLQCSRGYFSNVLGDIFTIFLQCSRGYFCNVLEDIFTIFSETFLQCPLGDSYNVLGLMYQTKTVPSIWYKPRSPYT